MELKIDKKDFLTGLEKTLSVVERRNTMPSLNHTLLDLKNDHLQISATDLEIFVSSDVSCEIVEDGRIAVPARNIYDIVKECDDKSPIHLKLTDANRLEIKSGKSEFKLVGLLAESFPHFKTSPKGKLSNGTLKTKEFVRLIQKTEHCICTEEYRYALTGIYLESENVDGVNLLRSVATDGHRLARLEIDETQIGTLVLEKPLIIPKKGSSELRKLLENSEEEEFELSCDENLIKASVGKNRLWIRPIDSEYPDYKRVIPQSLTSDFYVDKAALLSGLKRMSLLVSDRSKVVSFDFQKDRVALSTQNPDLGEARDEVMAELEGQSMNTGFNVRFFMDALNNFQGDKIKIQLGEKLQPAVLTEHDDPSYLIVIMPMRL